MVQKYEELPKLPTWTIKKIMALQMELKGWNNDVTNAVVGVLQDLLDKQEVKYGEAHGTRTKGQEETRRIKRGEVQD